MLIFHQSIFDAKHIVQRSDDLLLQFFGGVFVLCLIKTFYIIFVVILLLGIAHWHKTLFIQQPSS